MSFDETVAAMTLDQARWVRALRVDEGRTWRWIAEEWSMRSSPEHIEWDFLAGQTVCGRAASIFGEDAMVEPWN